MATNPDDALDVIRDRVGRAGEIRNAIGQTWNEYIERVPRRFGLTPGDAANHWVLVANTVEPMPTRLSTLFGEWLYELRAALDGAIYVLAVQDSSSNPPPNERGLGFPTFDRADRFDDSNHRARLKALSDKTFKLLRHVQPFNAKPDHYGNVLWWLDELARIDRHRYGHALASHVNHIKIGVAPPLTMVGNLLTTSPDGPIAIDETTPFRLIEVKAPAGWSAEEVQDSLDISEAATGMIDVTEWRARATGPMKGLTLEERMYRCEQFVINDIIEPLVTGVATLPTAVDESVPE